MLSKIGGTGISTLTRVDVGENIMGISFSSDFWDWVIAGIGIFALQAIAVFCILREIIRLLLRRDNSTSTIRKVKRGATFWGRLTNLCFWNMKSSCKTLLRFFIGYRVLMVTTAGLPLLLSISLCFDERWSVVCSWAVRIAYYVDMITLNFTGIYACVLHKRMYGKSA